MNAPDSKRRFAIRAAGLAHRAGYAAALLDLQTFLREETERWAAPGATPVADQIREGRQQATERVSAWIVASTPTDPPPEEPTR